MAQARQWIQAIAAPFNERWAGVFLLVWAAFVFFRNITSHPVETDEALYAAVGRQIARTNEWFRLEHEGTPFFYKPPLYFWLMAVAIKSFGENDFAVRFPSAALGLATTVLVYVAGKRLFSGRTALTAALITTTTYNLIWLAPQGKMDVELGFWLNLAFFSFLLAYREKDRQLGFLVLSFSAMTIATLLKGPIGLMLPGFAGLVYLLATRKSKTFSELPALAIGSAVLAGISSIYYLALGPDFNHYFFVVENLARITEESKPFYFYFYMIFADLFPWSFFIPCAAIALWKSGLLKSGTHEFATLLWFLSFFFFLNVPSYKEEDFLVYLVPPFALLIARSWEHVLSESKLSPAPTDRCYRASLISLSCVISFLLWIGPRTLKIRHPGFPSMISPSHFLFVLGGCLVAIYVALSQAKKTIFSTVCVIAMALTFFFAHFYRPAREQYNRVRAISYEVRSIVGDSPLVLSYTQGSTEFLYYLDRREPVRFVDREEARRLLRSDRKLFAVLLRNVYEEIKSGADFPLHKLAEYTHRHWQYVLVSN
jgi:4-amino-4-deoxy-L-arabinose transferase-like glycosyltransferase